jgi:hypothetical protein
MNRKQWLAALAIGVALGWFGIPSMAQSGNTFKGRLAKVPVDGKMVPDIIGTGMATATLTGTKATFTGTFEGLGTNATTVQLHQSKYRATRGPVIADLKVTQAASGTISGDVTLTADQVTALKAGLLYIQIQSVKGPEGHLWGWLLP